MKNLLNIDDKVKVALGEGKEQIVGNGEIVTIVSIQKINGEIYYDGAFHHTCPQGGDGYDTSIQFKEGQYEKIDSNQSSSEEENQEYINELKNEISDLEDKLKNITEERDQLLLMSQKYQAEYVLKK